MTNLNFEAEAFADFIPSRGDEPEQHHGSPPHLISIHNLKKSHGGHWKHHHFGRRWPWMLRGGIGSPDFTQDPQTIAWAQGCLAQVIGAWVPQDGTLGPTTRRAIRMFQTQSQLPSSGALDDSTVAALQQACSGDAGSDGAGAPGAPPSPPGEIPGFPHAFDEIGRESYAAAPSHTCRCGESELDELEEFEAPPARRPSLRYVKGFSSPVAECVDALKRAGKTEAEALTIIDTQIGIAIAMLRKAASELKRGSRSNATKDLFRAIFRVLPEFKPTWLKPTAAIQDRGDVVATRCTRVADLLESGTINFFCAINATNCPDCSAPDDWACSSWGDESVAPKRSNVICLGTSFWDDMKAGNTVSLLATVMHEPFHIYFGKYVTAHVSTRGKFGGIYCILKFVFDVNRRAPPPRVNERCAGMLVRAEVSPSFESEVLDGYGHAHGYSRRWPWMRRRGSSGSGSSPISQILSGLGGAISPLFGELEESETGGGEKDAGAPGPSMLVVWFELNSTKLRQDGEVDSVTQLAFVIHHALEHLKAAGKAGKVVVHGFASKEGAEDKNLQLSTRRAERVRALLIEAGVPSDRIQAVGHGAINDWPIPGLRWNRRAGIEFQP